jgi:hypothetical protein
VRIERFFSAGPSARPFYHPVAGSNSSATAKAEARRNDRLLRRNEQARPSVWIELITSDDRHRNQSPPSVWIDLITWDDRHRDQPQPSEWIDLITWDDRHRDQPQPVTVSALPNPFS